jgi:hypothetical protein
VVYLPFAGEAHGFRKFENNQLVGWVEAVLSDPYPANSKLKPNIGLPFVGISGLMDKRDKIILTPPSLVGDTIPSFIGDRCPPDLLFWFLK